MARLFIALPRQAPRWLMAGAALAALVLPGCLGPTRALPTPDQLLAPTLALTLPPPEVQILQSRLQRGRETLMLSCTDCHALPYPDTQAPAAWPGIVAKMSARAGLSADDREALTLYLQHAAKWTAPKPAAAAAAPAGSASTP